MAFPNSSSSTPKPDIAIQSNSYCNIGLDSEQQTGKIPLTRDARHAEQHDDNAHPLPPLRSSFQTVYGISTATTNLSLGSPSSWSTSNVSHPSSRSLENIKNGEPSPSSALSSPESPPLAHNNFLTSASTSKNEVSSSHSKNQFFIRLNPSVILQNGGSVARDHLASERTFLAYVHTSLSLSSAGVAIVQLLTIADFIIPKYSKIPMREARMKRFAMPLGVLSQVLALWILFLGVYRFFVVQHSLPKNMFPAARLSIAFLSFVFGVLVVVIFGAIWKSVE